MASSSFRDSERCSVHRPTFKSPLSHWLSAQAILLAALCMHGHMPSGAMRYPLANGAGEAITAEEPNRIRSVYVSQSCLGAADIGILSSAKRSSAAVCLMHGHPVRASGTNATKACRMLPDLAGLPGHPRSEISREAIQERGTSIEVGRQQQHVWSSAAVCATNAALTDPSFTNDLRLLPELLSAHPDLMRVLAISQDCAAVISGRWFNKTSQLRSNKTVKLLEDSSSRSSSSGSLPHSALDAALHWGAKKWLQGGPPCAHHCCSVEQMVGSFMPHGETGGVPLRTASGCSLHAYGVPEAARCLSSQYSGRGPHVLLVGDSMLRQLYLRLVSLAREQDFSLDVGQRRNHSRYVMYVNGSDTHEYGDPDNLHVLMHWAEASKFGRCSKVGSHAAGNVSEGQWQRGGLNFEACNSKSVIFEAWFVWSPRFVDVRRDVMSLGKIMAGSGGSGGPVLVVGVWFWHTKHSWGDAASQASWRAMLETLSPGRGGRLKGGGRGDATNDVKPGAGRGRPAWASRLVILNTPTGRMTRDELIPHTRAMRERNAELQTWVQRQQQGPRAEADGGATLGAADRSLLLLDFDALSTAQGAPEGQIGNNWHYMCELRSSQEYGGSASKEGTNAAKQTWPGVAAGLFLARGEGGRADPVGLQPWCLVPSSSGSCFDAMNGVVWQLMWNLLCNGGRGV